MRATLLAFKVLLRDTHTIFKSDLLSIFIISLSHSTILYKTFIKSSSTLLCRFSTNETYSLGYYRDNRFSIDISCHHC